MNPVGPLISIATMLAMMVIMPSYPKAMGIRGSRIGVGVAGVAGVVLIGMVVNEWLCELISDHIISDDRVQVMSLMVLVASSNIIVGCLLSYLYVDETMKEIAGQVNNPYYDMIATNQAVQNYLHCIVKYVRNGTLAITTVGGLSKCLMTLDWSSAGFSKDWSTGLVMDMIKCGFVAIGYLFVPSLLESSALGPDISEVYQAVYYVSVVIMMVKSLITGITPVVVIGILSMTILSYYIIGFASKKYIENNYEFVKLSLELAGVGCQSAGYDKRDFSDEEYDLIKDSTHIYITIRTDEEERNIHLRHGIINIVDPEVYMLLDKRSMRNYVYMNIKFIDNLGKNFSVGGTGNVLFIISKLFGSTEESTISSEIMVHGRKVVLVTEDVDVPFLESKAMFVMAGRSE